MTAVRVVAAIIFFVLMLVVNKAAHAVVGMGFAAWLVGMGVIFWVGISIENRDRAKAGRSPYSWEDARSDMLGPFTVAAAMMAVAYLIYLAR